MKDSTDDRAATAVRYRAFGEIEAAGMSPVYEEWALGISDDADLLALIDSLPPARRQPNLVFGAARFLGADPGSFEDFRAWFLANTEAVLATARQRTTQTNEPARCATLLPALAEIPGPLALIEVGASAGLCLFPDRYSYRYLAAGDAADIRVRRIDPPEGTSPVVLDCAVSGAPPLPAALPEIVWRAGIDLNPLDVASDDDLAWLDALIWPEHEARRARLRAAAALAATEPPRIDRGDLLERLPALAAEAPSEATLVVLHTAVLAYLPPEKRADFVDLVPTLPGHWVSNEGRDVLPGIRQHPPVAGRPASDFVLAVDGRQVASVHPHGAALHWLGAPD